MDSAIFAVTVTFLEDARLTHTGARFTCRERLHMVRRGTSGARNRPDKDGTHRAAFDKNKKRIYATQTVCALCGRPVDFSLKFPHPMSATIDHIVPVSKGGHPSDIDNLQLAHLSCNRAKADKTAKIVFLADDKAISNRILPQSMNWSEYRSK